MKDRPINLHYFEVKNALRNDIIQVRRVIKKLYRFGKITELHHSPMKGYDWRFRDKRKSWNDISNDEFIRFGPYKIGMKLWVRETWAPCDHSGQNPPEFIKYKATNTCETPCGVVQNCDYVVKEWKSPFFMSHWASRITLEITDIRVEKLRSMTTEDAIAEGMTSKLAVKLLSGKDYLPYCIIVGGMKMLWNSLAKKGFKWEDDPCVWVCELKKVKR